MYSRYHNLRGKPVQLPENYGGSAFAEPNSSSLSGNPTARDLPPATDMRRMEIARPTLPNPIPVMPEPPQPEQKGNSPQQDLHPQLGGAGFLNSIGRHLPTQGVGFEELLILGLILLLSQSEQGSDIVLWLALLLFCG